MKKNLFTIALLAPFVLAANVANADQPEQPKDWRFSVGAGVVSGPASLGADKRKTTVVPGFDVRYKDWFFINPAQGIGVKTQLDNLTLSGALGVDMNQRDPKASAQLANIKKVSIAPALILGADYKIGKFSTEAILSTRLANSSKGGSTLTLQESYPVYAKGPTVVKVGVKGRLMDNRFAQNFVSISSADSQRTGLPEYKAKAGLLDVGFFAQASAPMSKHWRVSLKAEVSQLQGSARKSPIVEKRTSLTVSAFTTYTF